ncbi:MAG: hypothetical protein ABIA75_08610 [Candidatus Neomarinimicrobiota bacterium]
MCFHRFFLLAAFSLFFLSAGQYSDAFLNIGAGPRSIGLGQAVCALPENPTGYLVNPAASGFVAHSQAALMYINQFDLADLTAITTTVRWRGDWKIGLNLINFSVDGIPERPDLRRIIDLETRRDSIRTLVAGGFRTFRDRETAVFLNMVHDINKTFDLGWMITPFPVRISAGVNIKLLNKALYGLIGNGIGLDIGSMLSFSLADAVGYGWMGDLTLGLAFTDAAGTLVYWNSGKTDRIPPAVTAGFGYRQTFRSLPVEMTFLYQKKTIETDSNLGLEIVCFNLVAVRVGDNLGRRQGGLGLRIPVGGNSVSIDYSFTAHNLGNAHRIGAGIYF